MAHDSEPLEYYKPQMVATFLSLNPVEIHDTMAVVASECNNPECPDRCANVQILIFGDMLTLNMRFDPFKAELLGMEIIEAAQRQKKMLATAGYNSLDDFLAKSKPHD